MLLLNVEASIDESQELAFNEYYYKHMPRLMTAPGYESGRRFQRLSGNGAAYLALYEIADQAFLPSLLGDDMELRHPVSVGDWAEWDEKFVPYMTRSRINVYSPDGAGSGPFFTGDHPIALVELTNPSSTDASVGRLLQNPDVVSARSFQANDTDCIQWLKTDPQRILLLELSGHAAAAAVEG